MRILLIFIVIILEIIVCKKLLEKVEMYYSKGEKKEVLISIAAIAVFIIIDIALVSFSEFLLHVGLLLLWGYLAYYSYYSKPSKLMFYVYLTLSIMNGIKLIGLIM